MKKILLSIYCLLSLSATSALARPSHCIGKTHATLRWDVDFINQDGKKSTLYAGTTVKIVNYPVVENTTAIIQVLFERIVAYPNRNNNNQIISCSAAVVSDSGIIPWGFNWLRGPFDCNLQD